MIWRVAQQQDIPSIQTFLRRHVQSSMFPLGNLRDHGLNGAHPRSMNFWLLGDTPRGVLGLTNEGMILPQCPALTEAELAAMIDLVRGRKIIGVIGETAQVRGIIHKAGWDCRSVQLNDDEPAFSLDLDALILPQIQDMDLVPLAAVDRNLAVEWRRTYLLETPGLISGNVTKQAERDVERYVDRDSHRMLLHQGRPVSMTGFNAALPDVVQIGGVFTPPELRRRGFARAAVALHLDEARGAGVRRAVLFAASNAAARAYIAIGFAPAGTFSLVLFNT